MFLSTWYELPPAFWSESEALNAMGSGFWSRVISVREAVSKELEKLRVAGTIGSSLDAEVDLYVDDETRAMLAALEDELRFVFITSYARVHAADEHPADAVDAAIADMSVWVRVTPSAWNKCSRCWHHREDVGSHDVHPGNLRALYRERRRCR